MEKALYTLNTLRIEHLCDYDDLTAKIKPNTFRSVELSLRHHRCTPTLLEADFPPLCIQSFDDVRLCTASLKSPLNPAEMRTSAIAGLEIYMAGIRRKKGIFLDDQPFLTTTMNDRDRDGNGEDGDKKGQDDKRQSCISSFQLEYLHSAVLLAPA
jgi:hypothetical protein